MKLIPWAQGVQDAGLGTTTGYKKRAAGLIVEPIMVGNRGKMTESESEALGLAVAAGFKDDELGLLAQQMKAARQDLASHEEVIGLVHKIQAERLARGTNVDDARHAWSDKGRRMVAARIAKAAG